MVKGGRDDLDGIEGIRCQGVGCDRRSNAIPGGRILPDGAEKCPIATRTWQRTKSGRRAGVTPLARRRRARAWVRSDAFSTR